jgi:hypothetical protein
MARFLVIVALFALVFSAGLFATSFSVRNKCLDSNGKISESCVVKNAQQPSDCNLINSGSYYKEDCFDAVALKTDSCESLGTEKSLETCIIARAYRQNTNMTACAALDSTYQEKCYAYYVSKNSPGNLDACDSVPTQYQTECQRKQLRSMMGVTPSEDFCNGVKEKYKDLCLEEAKGQQQLIGMFGGSMLLMVGGCFVVIVILVVVFRAVTGNKGNSSPGKVDWENKGTQGAPGQSGRVYWEKDANTQPPAQPSQPQAPPQQPQQPPADDDDSGSGQ